MLKIRYSTIDGKYYLENGKGKRYPLSILGNGFDTFAEAEQRKADVESGKVQESGKRVAVGFNPIA